MKPLAYLIVESGSPFEKGAFIPINRPQMIVGRRGSNWQPDISFHNIFVSRRHFSISLENDIYFIKDLNSKHGTFVNNQPLIPNEEFILKNSAEISIANKLIKMSFSTSNIEQTADIVPTVQMCNWVNSFALDPLKQEMSIQGNAYVFTDKEFKCIELLLSRSNQFVAIDELKSSVWKERTQMVGELPDVSSDEVNALIYRVRKKTRDIIQIENIRGKGYILSFNKITGLIG
ncbi:FHA domain-containing protein [Bacillus tuaregi]|uniref:FHA domain-containing protein n=1 Tax=Bacillus tuaregi TaxID=1816695 RepID=UPI0008F892A9|nr:FHA domain-containing protein [Bacillus tuaregi]